MNVFRDKAVRTAQEAAGHQDDWSEFEYRHISNGIEADELIDALRQELAELRDDKHNWIGAGMPAAISGYRDRADRSERALLEIVHLPDNADLHQATLIALRACPVQS